MKENRKIQSSLKIYKKLISSSHMYHKLISSQKLISLLKAGKRNKHEVNLEFIHVTIQVFKDIRRMQRE